MDFIYGSSIVLGTCSNLSESGLRGSFAESVPAGSEGLLTLYYADQKFEVQAIVDSAQEEETRLRFQFRSDKERSTIAALLKLLGSKS